MGQTEGRGTEMKELECLRCWYSWIPRKEDFRQCPRCRRYTWDKNSFKKLIKVKYCSVANCNNSPSALGYCSFHYNRHKSGVPLTEPKYESKRGKNNYNWNGGTWGYTNSSVMMKNRLIKLAEHSICEHCQEKPATEIHHIDEGRTNHELSNLMAVCHKCNCGSLCTKIRTNKIRRKYGKSVKEFSEIYKLPQSFVRLRLKNNISLNFPKYSRIKKQVGEK